MWVPGSWKGLQGAGHLLVEPGDVFQMEMKMGKPDQQGKQGKGENEFVAFHESSFHSVAGRGRAPALSRRGGGAQNGSMKVDFQIRRTKNLGGHDGWRNKTGGSGALASRTRLILETRETRASSLEVCFSRVRN